MTIIDLHALDFMVYDNLCAHEMDIFVREN